jgi:hypothetical protein
VDASASAWNVPSVYWQPSHLTRTLYLPDPVTLTPDGSFTARPTLTSKPSDSHRTHPVVPNDHS